MAVEPKLEEPQAIPTTMAPAHGVSRRRLLQAAGGVCGVVVAGTLYRAYDQGVFTTGEGPAYDAWREWDAETGGVPLGQVRGGGLARDTAQKADRALRRLCDRI